MMLECPFTYGVALAPHQISLCRPMRINDWEMLGMAQLLALAFVLRPRDLVWFVFCVRSLRIENPNDTAEELRLLTL